LRTSEADILALQLIFSRARIAAADHGFAAAELPARDEPHGAAARARHDGYEGVLGLTQLRLIFKDENRSWVHSFGYPFFQKLQVG
jgi:hypothetical protein